MSTIKQKKVTIEIEGFRAVEVRRMRWKSMREFLRKLAEIVSKVAANASQDQSLRALVLGKLPEIISGSDELVSFLCVESSDVTIAELNELDALAVSAVLGAALSVNCDEEIKNCWGGIVANLGAVMSPAPKQTTK